MKQLADLKRRLSVSSVAGVVVVLLIAFSTFNVVSGLLALAVALMAAVGVWEYGRLIRAKGLHPHVPLMMGVAVAEVFAFFICLKVVDMPLLPLMILGISFVLFFLSHFKESTNALPLIAVEFFSICYIAIPLSFLLGILYPVSQHAVAQDGRWWLLYLILVTKITDVGAYFVGRLWGKHKLAPLLSPKKTIEGALAGFLCALAISGAFAFFGKKFSNGSFDLTLAESLWLGASLSVAGQIGDLAESLLKRDADVKDSNRLPGLGGVLDMIDSLLITAPILYLFLRMH